MAKTGKRPAGGATPDELHAHMSALAREIQAVGELLLRDLNERFKTLRGHASAAAAAAASGPLERLAAEESHAVEQLRKLLGEVEATGEHSLEEIRKHFAALNREAMKRGAAAASAVREQWARRLPIARGEMKRLIEASEHRGKRLLEEIGRSYVEAMEMQAGLYGGPAGSAAPAKPTARRGQKATVSRKKPAARKKRARAPAKKATARRK
jgi:hypothetical protein